MTQNQLRKLLEDGTISIRVDTIREVEDFLYGWDFYEFYDWHEKDAEADSGDRYYEVIINRLYGEAEPEKDSYGVTINAFYYCYLWQDDGEYYQCINYNELLEVVR